MEKRLKTFLIFVVLLATALKVVKSRAVGSTEFGDQNALRKFFNDVIDFGTEAPETEDSSENNVKNELQNSERIDPFEFSDLSLSDPDLFSLSDEDMEISDDSFELEFEEDESNSRLSKGLKKPTDVPANFKRKRGKYDIVYSLSEPNQLPESLKDAKVPEQTTNNKWISKPGTSSHRSTSFDGSFTDPVDIPSAAGRKFENDPPVMEDRKKFGDFKGSTTSENPVASDDKLSQLIAQVFQENHNGGELEHNNSFGEDSSSPADIPSTVTDGFESNPPTMTDRRKFGDFNGFTPPENPTSHTFRPFSTVNPDANRKENGDNVDHSSNGGNSLNQDFTSPVDIPSPGSGDFGRNPPTMDDRRKFGDFNGFTPPENQGVQRNRPTSESAFLSPLSTEIPDESRKQDGEDLDRSTNRGNSFNQDFTDPVDIPSPGSGGFGRNPPTMDDRRKFGDFNGFTRPENPGVENNRPTSESVYLPPLSTLIPDANRKEDGGNVDHSSNGGNSFNQDFTDPVDIPSPGSGGFGRNPPTMDDRRKFEDFNGFTPPENPGVENNRPTSDSVYLPPLSTLIPDANRKEDGGNVDRSSNGGNSFNQGFTVPVDIPSPGSGGFGKNPPTMDDRMKFGDFNGFTPPENPASQTYRPLSTVVPDEEDGGNVDRSTNRGNSFNQDFTDPVDISSPGSGGFGRNPPAMDDREKFGDFNGFTPPVNPGVENNRPPSQSIYVPPLSTLIPGENRKQYGQEVDRSTKRGNSFNQDFRNPVEIPSPGSGGFGRNPPTMDDQRQFGDFNGFTPPENRGVHRNRPTSESGFLPPLSTVIPQSNRKEGGVGRSFDGSSSYSEDIMHPVDIPSAGSDGFGRNPPALDDRRKFGNFNGFTPAYNVRDGGHPRLVMPPYESGQFRQPHYFNQPIGGFHSQGNHGNYKPPPFGGHTHTPLSGPSGHYDYNRMGSVQHAPHRHITPLPQPHPRPHPHNGMHYLPPVNYNRPIPLSRNSNGNFHHSSYRG